MSKSTSEPPTPRWGTTRLTESDRYHLLSAERRRILLDVLEERTTPVGLDELAVAVAEREGNGGAVAAETGERVATTLHHNHLPRMADLGVIDYDPESQRVRTG